MLLTDRIYNLSTRVQCNINALQATRNDNNPEEMRRHLTYLENFLGEIDSELDLFLRYINNKYGTTNMAQNLELEIPDGKKPVWVNDVLTLVDDKPQDVTERIKTFSDACRELGSDHPFVKAYDGYVSHIHQHDMNDYDLVAYLQLRIITAALNEGWEPQFTKGEQRWYFWYDLITKEQYDKLSAEDKSRVVYRSSYYAYSNGGVSYASAYYDSSGTYASIGSRLAFKSEKLAAYAGRQFAEIYADFCFKPKSEEKKG